MLLKSCLTVATTLESLRLQWQNCLQAKGVIRLFKLGCEETALVVINSDDLVNHITQHCPKKPAINRFLNNVILKVQDVSIDKALLQGDMGFSQQDISDLMNAGLLTLRSAGSFWFSFPNAGEFMRSYLKGRKSVLRTIRKCKFSEILQFELQQRKLEKSAKLGILYHIHDIIGAELVKCVETTSGTLLRLTKK
ncbi:serine/threonine-protein kinase 19-like isoform X2 [Zootermopsis nevadensis]|uniref:serine/threonine-protein kinase 19-like isoform X2 n=1 Tax=Zootermopsis nevadensis TaxID=136037 RepID=UPI000B8E48DB|nr:serine/threonine-protein kinase 19-like isoform X2 [Zootermopsis nevadensis]